MKASFEFVSKTESVSSLKQLVLNLPDFEPYWHFHPEFELTYIISGSGKRIVGDSMDEFYPGDMVLLGPDLPHTWNSVDNEDRKGNCRAVVFQFSERLIPGRAEEFPEFDNVRRLLEMAWRGIFFRHEISNLFEKKLIQLSKNAGLEKLSTFWLILNQLSKTPHYNLIASANYVPSISKYHGERINKVFKYVSVNFAEDIRLAHLAGLTHMTETSFSRFFKMITGETFSEYLNNTRIANAARLLVEKRSISINEVAIESGFKSSTHFNRMFFQKKGCSPSNFRKEHIFFTG
jgi:AraC-like DNA-binding protein